MIGKINLFYQQVPLFSVLLIGTYCTQPVQNPIWFHLFGAQLLTCTPTRSNVIFLINSLTWSKKNLCAHISSNYIPAWCTVVFISLKLFKGMRQVFDSILFAHCQDHTAVLFLVSGWRWDGHPPVLLMCFIRNQCLGLRKAIGLSTTTRGRDENSQSNYRKRLRNELHIIPNCKMLCSTTQLSLIRLTISCEIPRQLLLFALKYCWGHMEFWHSSWQSGIEA